MQILGRVSHESPWIAAYSNLCLQATSVRQCALQSCSDASVIFPSFETTGAVGAEAFAKAPTFKPVKVLRQAANVLLACVLSVWPCCPFLTVVSVVDAGHYHIAHHMLLRCCTGVQQVEQMPGRTSQPSFADASLVHACSTAPL